MTVDTTIHLNSGFSMKMSISLIAISTHGWLNIEDEKLSYIYSNNSFAATHEYEQSTVVHQKTSN